MKKLLSLFLVFTILSGLLSGIGFAAEAQDLVVEYSFKQGDYSGATNAEGKYPDDVIKYLNSGGRVEFLKSTYTNSAGVAPETPGKWNGGYANITTKNGAYVAFKINVPKAGAYAVKYEHLNRSGNSKTPQTDVYIIPYAEDISAALSAATALFRTTKVTDTTGSGTGLIADTGSFTAAQAGEHLLVIKATGNSYIRPAKLTLTMQGGGEAILNCVALNIESNTATVRAWKSDGREIELDARNITYESSDPTISDVEENGKITDKRAGNVTITATVSIDGAELRATAKHTAGIVTVKYDFALGTAIGSGKDGTDIDKIKNEVTFNNTGNFYQYYTSGYYVEGKTTPAGYKPFYNRGNHIQLNYGGYASFEINLPVSGNYNFKAQYPITNGGNTAYVYICEKADFDPTNGKFGTQIAQYSNRDESSANSNGNNLPLDGEIAITGNPRELSADKEYILTFRNRSSGTSAGYPVFGSFCLLGESDPVVMGAKLALNPGKATVTALMSDGTEADMSEATVEYTSSDNSIASLDEDGNITEKKTDKVVISASVTINEKTVSASKEYKSISPDAPGIDIFYDLGADLAANGMTSGSGLAFKTLGRGQTNGHYAIVHSTNVAETSGQMQFRSSNITVRHNHVLAIEVLIPQAGIYDMEMWNAATDQGADIEVYLSKGTYTTNANAKVGQYRCYDAEISYNPSYFKDIVKEPNVIEDIRIEEPGWYVFTFKGNASWRADVDKYYTYNYGSVGSFRLISGDDAVLLGAIFGEIDADTEYIIAYPDENTITYTDPVEKGKTQFNIFTKLLDGTVLGSEYSSIKLKSSEEEIATVDADGLVHAIGDGDFEISAEVLLGGKTYSGSVAMNAYDNTGIRETILDIPTELYEREKRKTKFTAIMNSGNSAVVPAGVPITYTYEPEGIVEIDSAGTVTGLSKGETTVTATAFFKGEQIEDSVKVSVSLDTGKQEPTYYTYERREIAKENISKYKWARAERDEAVKKAAKYINDDAYLKLYELAPREGLPRARQVSNFADNEYYKYCRYCGADVESANAGGYGAWGKDPINRPWKLQCTHCKRLFPSNDFELLYERGLDENGVYNVDLARENNAIAVENGEKDALVNELYPEIGSQRTPENGGEPGTVVTLNNGRGLRPGETVEGWGVDDGWGYRPKDENGKNYTIAGGDIEIHCYIASYTWQFWNVYESAMGALADAYLYTGDEKYGCAGAILLDRYADLFSEYDLSIQNKKDGARLNNYGYGYIRNRVADTESLSGVVLRADILYPMTADSQVISFLSKKAEELGLENKKSSRSEIWDNWKNGILLEVFEGVKNGRLGGNFGMYQRLIASAAVVLDEEPETTEMVEWIYAAGSTSASTVKGGNILAQLVNDVDRDGMGDESGDNYNSIWVTRLFEVSDILGYYKGKVNYNLWEHPKFAQMFTPYLKKVLVNNQLAQVGDSGSPGITGLSGDDDAYLQAFKEYEGTRIGDTVARYLYLRKKGDLSGLHYDIFTRDPEAALADIEAAALKNAEQKNDLMAGYGFGILRDGGEYASAVSSGEVNNLRDAWLYFGAASSHTHDDNLTLGLEAFGLNIAPDNGYPERTGKDANRLQWFQATISHNTVSVDGISSAKSSTIHGDPLHFDSTDRVKVLDVDAKTSYENTENYRRTLVMVKVDDDISYTMDFFRITGGDVHTYSFHSQAENAAAVQGLEMTEQKDENGNWVGSYASGYDADGNFVRGVNVPYKNSKGSWTDANGNPYLFTGPGQDPYTKNAWEYDTYFPRGYTWMSKVRYDETPENTFAVEFEVEDYRKTLRNGKGIRLRLTQLNGFTPSEVAIVAGGNPRKTNAAVLPETFDYMLVTRKGENLDSLFATVLEPYRNTRYIEKIEPCTIDGVSAEDPTVRAVKVTHTGGERVDYIVYAEDNSKTHRIDNLFDFQGFVGVYSVNKNGEVLNRYVNDGTVIGDETDGSILGEDSEKPGAYSGTVSGFDGEMNFGDFENYIDIDITNAEITEELLSDITGRWIYIENDGLQSGAYEIFGATKLSDKTVRLDTGNVTNIRKYIDSYKPEEGYVYNFAIGDRFSIPMSYSDDASPEFEPVSDGISTSAGSSVSVKVSATSPLEGKTVTYEATTLPRGASLNSETGVFTWKPDDNQVGQNHVAITAVDSDGRQSTIHFDVTVYGKTTGSSSSNKEENNTPSDNSGTAGGGGGGGAAAPTDTPDDETKTDENDTSDKTDDESLPLEEKVPSEGEADEVEKTQFTDLANHAWAEDEINALAADGIIKGTSASTFSPASNITRADFALLLVRAFELTSDNTENFADVSAGDYFASELAIARNTGIVGGIGDNKYAPRNNITRQDMMVIVYRALQSLLLEEKGDRRMAVDEVLSKYPDYSTVAPYAHDAVSALIGAELVNGKNGRIAPTDYTTRAEVAVLIKRILEYTKKQI